MRTVSVLALALLLPACWVPLERGRQMEGRINALEAAQADHARRLEEQQKLIQGRVAAADRKIAEVQAKIDELNQAARRSGADLGVQQARLADEVAKLRGELEVARHDLSELDKQVAAYKARTEKRFAGLAGKGALDEVNAQERLDALPNKDDRAAVLALAQKVEADGEKGTARALYDIYVRRWPEDPAAPEAALRSGDILAGQRRFNDALISYGWVYEQAPRSDKLPEAMLGMGNALIALEDARARPVLEELVQRFPRSPVAAKARERLAKLRPAPKKPPTGPGKK